MPTGVRWAFLARMQAGKRGGHLSAVGSQGIGAPLQVPLDVSRGHVPRLSVEPDAGRRERLAGEITFPASFQAVTPIMSTMCNGGFVYGMPWTPSTTTARAAEAQDEARIGLTPYRP